MRTAGIGSGVFHKICGYHENFWRWMGGYVGSTTNRAQPLAFPQIIVAMARTGLATFGHMAEPTLHLPQPDLGSARDAHTIAAIRHPLVTAVPVTCISW